MEKKTRARAFFGLHHDFHADGVTRGIGLKTTAENVGAMLDAVKPDYLQFDTKGHAGYTSFFSEYGDVAPGLVADHLKIIREETKKRGILLIAHHSGLWDEAAAKRHPEWQMVDRNGNYVSGMMDFTGPYAKEKFIPQIKELAGKYGSDGIWIDGDFWALHDNFCPALFDKFKAETGITEVGGTGTDSLAAYREFTMREYEKYLQSYIREIKKDFPNFEVCVNYLYSYHRAVKPIPEIDFLSGDAHGYYGRAYGMIFAAQDKPWDIMLWHSAHCIKGVRTEFRRNGVKNTKVMCRACATSFSLGGGAELCNPASPYGELLMFDMPRFVEIAKFARAREPFNYGSKPVRKGCAILFSEYNRVFGLDEGSFPYRESGYGGEWYDYMVRDLPDVLLDGGLPANIVLDHHVADGELDGFSTVFLPELKRIEESAKKKMLEYARAGGNLVVCGAECCKQFMSETSAKIVGSESLYVMPSSGENYATGVVNALMFDNIDGEPICECRREYVDHGAPSAVTAFRKKYGKGSIVYVGFGLFTEYVTRRDFTLRDIVRELAFKLDPEPTAYLESGIKRVNVFPAEKDGKLIVNVINACEYYDDSKFVNEDDFPPLNDLVIAVKTERKPEKVFLEPGHRPARFTFDGKYAHVSIDKLDIHDIITFE